MRAIRLIPAIATLIVLAACHTGVNEPQGSPFNGTWYQEAQVPGSTLLFNLIVYDTTVSGSGSYSIEAGQSGAVSVTGVVTGGGIKLSIARSIGDTLHFNGVAVSESDLSGFGYWTGPTVLGVSDPAPVKFFRLRPID